ncbi:SO2930 family diheme c-type cytochrome [Lysobacter cavernae]|uniref:SO2930 family diheme c-type cytochrome n=1 Tax=Lysobacter cavernae TaxID=1685901 RepID=A0ABV7RPN9_9GAMM
MKYGYVMAAVLAALSMVGCKRSAEPVSFHAQGQPAKLSDWHVFNVEDGHLRWNDGVEPYALNTALFSDYAHKLRTIWMPPGTKATYQAEAALDFPVGTIISKTFYYPRASGGAGAVLRVAERVGESRDGLDLKDVRLIETRLLVRRESGWVALPYVWNAQQTEAELARAGDTVSLEMHLPEGGEPQRFTYLVPDENQCAGCHATNNTTRELQPIGPKARHLNRDDPWHPGEGHAGENQLARMARLGRLEGLPAADIPRNARFDDARAKLEDRARAYLDVNCGHCHNPKGPADTSGLWLDAATDEPRRLGLCKPPVAAGQGTGDHLFDIVPGQPDASILVYRMDSLDPGAMMPELGRSTVHEEGVAVIRDWIKAWLGSCSSEGEPSESAPAENAQVAMK